MRSTITIALGLAAVVAAGLTLSCSSGPVEPGDTFIATGTVTYCDFEGGFWAIDGDDGELYDPLGFPSNFETEGLPVGFIAEMTNHGSFHMVGPVVEIKDIWLKGTRYGGPFRR